MFLSTCTYLLIQIQERKSLHTPFPAMLFYVCYNLRPGILSKSPKEERWVRQQGIYLSPVALLLPSNPKSWFQIPQPTSRGDYQTQDSWSWGRSLSSLWKLEDWIRRMGSGWQLPLQVLPLLPHVQLCTPDLSPWLPRPSPTKRIRKLPVRRNWGLGWPDPGPGWGKLVWDPPQDWGQGQWFTNNTGGSLL